MSITSLFDVLCTGGGARLALGVSVITYLLAYNEVSSPALVFGTILAAVYGSLAAYCKCSLRAVQIPYIRASNRFDFGCLFLANWLDALALICSCAILARTLSVCLDAMTGGMARIMILGRNSPSNEPWPDVLGIGSVFVVSGMFMLGLEHSKAFSLIMTMSMLGLNAIISAVSWWKADFAAWHEDYFQPNGIDSLLLASALLTFSFPSDIPSQRGGNLQHFIGIMLFTLATVSLELTAICLASFMRYKSLSAYFAAPYFTILDEFGFHNSVAAAACLLLLTSSCAFLELFPELYGKLVRFATAEWKIFTKQISYESVDSGNPVLAIFIAGSLTSMLAFVCPLQNLCHALAASHLCAMLLRAFYLLYMPYRPKFMQPNGSDSSTLSYSRLSTAPMIKHSASSSSGSNSSRPNRSFWNLSLSRKSVPKRARAKKKPRREVEKEWLLLGEPASPCPQRTTCDVQSTVLSVEDTPPSDFEFPDRIDKSDTDSSTDIDAIVDEYRQKIKVTTAGPMEHTIRIPTVNSWRVMIFAIVVIGLGIALTIAGIAMRWPPAILVGSIGVFIISVITNLIPKYTGSIVNVSPVICGMLLLLSCVLFAACARHSWPGIAVWIVAGIVLLIRCDKYLCNCFERTTIIDDQLIASVSAASTTTIRLPRPPKRILTIPMHINEPR